MGELRCAARRLKTWQYQAELADNHRPDDSLKIDNYKQTYLTPNLQLDAGIA
jgi:hypothetical protein